MCQDAIPSCDRSSSPTTTRWILTLPTRQDLSHDDVIDIVALDASARHRVLNNDGAEFMRRNRPIERSNRRPRRRNNNDFSWHLGVSVLIGQRRRAMGVEALNCLEPPRLSFLPLRFRPPNWLPVRRKNETGPGIRNFDAISAGLIDVEKERLVSRPGDSGRHFSSRKWSISRPSLRATGWSDRPLTDTQSSKRAYWERPPVS